MKSTTTKLISLLFIFFALTSHVQALVDKQKLRNLEEKYMTTITEKAQSPNKKARFTVMKSTSTPKPLTKLQKAFWGSLGLVVGLWGDIIQAAAMEAVAPLVDSLEKAFPMPANVVSLAKDVKAAYDIGKCIYDGKAAYKEAIEADTEKRENGYSVYLFGVSQLPATPDIDKVLSMKISDKECPAVQLQIVQQLCNAKTGAPNTYQEQLDAQEAALKEYGSSRAKLNPKLMNTKIPKGLQTQISKDSKMPELVCGAEGYYTKNPKKWFCGYLHFSKSIRTIGEDFMKNKATSWWTKFKSFMSALADTATCLWEVEAVKDAITKTALYAAVKGTVTALSAVTPIGWIIKAIQLLMNGYDVYQAVMAALDETVEWKKWFLWGKAAAAIAILIKEIALRKRRRTLSKRMRAIRKLNF